MAYVGNQPLLAAAMAPYGVAAVAGQTYFPVPGGVVPGLNIVAVGGAMLSPGDFDDSDGLGINIAAAYPTGVASGTQLQVYAMSYNTSYVPVQGQMAGFRNVFINGNFDFWQRGTSLAAGTGTRYCADRWSTTATGSTVAPSQQAFALGQTAVPGEPTYFHRSVVVTAAGAGNLAVSAQVVEGVRTFAGQSAILSFWAKADASKNIAVEFAQGFGTGGSPSAGVTGIGVTTCALTTNWQRFRVPVTVPSIAGKTLGTNGDDTFGVNFWFDAGSSFNSRTNSLGQQSGTFDIAQAQFEAGSVATQFEMRPRATELVLCQRYFWRINATIDTFYATGLVQNNGTTASVYWKLPQTMRTVPTINSTGTLHIFDGSNVQTMSGVALAHHTVDVAGGDYTLSAALSTNRPAVAIARAGAIIDHSAEL